MSETYDARDRRLDELVEAARTERVTGMSEAEAELVLGRVMAQVRSSRPRRRLLWWGGGAAAAAALAVAFGLPARPVPPETRRVARQTVIHVESEGREILIEATAYEPED